jgi:hypothetical protein
MIFSYFFQRLAGVSISVLLPLEAASCEIVTKSPAGQIHRVLWPQKECRNTCKLDDNPHSSNISTLIRVPWVRVITIDYKSITAMHCEVLSLY